MTPSQVKVSESDTNWYKSVVPVSMAGRKNSASQVCVMSNFKISATDGRTRLIIESCYSYESETDSASYKISPSAVESSAST